ncbi:hypothetical protein ACIQPP_49105 [Streptomyces violaceusniger]|uniref:hypothetical protein n=1 Tax=Streptomyces violaceusniger TaxID=68280 RepID=UPI0009C1EBE0|nr:hypothetical protein [Streptomyces hygroscopicus]AQW48443.1 putative transposase YbfD/YdcC associated with H repeats [Streptomyces hygroscopicus]
MLITADALHAHDENAQHIVERGGHYLSRIKGNRKKLFALLNGLNWEDGKHRSRILPRCGRADAG